MKPSTIKTWARSWGYAVRREPEELAGDVRGWCVPLNRRRGWLFESGASVGVHYLGSHRQVDPVLAALRRLPGWKEQTVAEDGFLGWVPWDAWSAAFDAALHPRRARRLARQGSKPHGKVAFPPLKRSGWPHGRSRGPSAGTPPINARSPGTDRTNANLQEPPNHDRA